MFWAFSLVVDVEGVWLFLLRGLKLDGEDVDEDWICCSWRCLRRRRRRRMRMVMRMKMPARVTPTAMPIVVGEVDEVWDLVFERGV